MTLTEIGEQINAHLKRFERDPAINLDKSENGTGLFTFYNAGARRAGNRVDVVYISYQGSTMLTKQQAADYLHWLNKGNIGRHFEANHGATA